MQSRNLDYHLWRLVACRVDTYYACKGLDKRNAGGTEREKENEKRDDETIEKERKGDDDVAFIHLFPVATSALVHHLRSFKRVSSAVPS